MGKKLKYTKDECSAIKRWLKIEGHSQAKLADSVKPPLKSSTAIAQWLSRGRVSKWYIEQIKEICK